MCRSSEMSRNSSLPRGAYFIDQVSYHKSSWSQYNLVDGMSDSGLQVFAFTWLNAENAADAIKALNC